MTTILAAIDGSIYSQSVAAHAAWAASRIGASVDLMQVLGRRELPTEDRSGRLVAGARRQLLEELAALDSERSKLLIKQARLDLEDAAAAVAAQGVEATTTLRNGDLLDALAKREAQSELLVVGKRGEAADFAKLHLGSNLERILRGARGPVFIASRAFRPIKRFMIAFDGRPSSMKAVSAIAASPLLNGLAGVIAMAGEQSAEANNKHEEATRTLIEAGLQVEKRSLSGAAKSAIPDAVESDAIDLLVMGAYGHSRLRTLVIGSTTSEVIRGSLIPVLVYR